MTRRWRLRDLVVLAVGTGIIGTGIIGAEPGGISPARAQTDSEAEIRPLPVALVVDLETPVVHSPDAGPRIEPAGLERTLDAAEVLTAHPEVPVTVVFNPEILDALAQTGESNAIDLLRAAAAGNEVTLTPWTPLDIAAWLAAGRADVVLDGFARATAALEAAGIATGATSPIGAGQADAAAWLAQAVSAASFVIEGPSNLADARANGPSFVTGPNGERLTAIAADLELAARLAAAGPGATRTDAELMVRPFFDELRRRARASGDGAVVMLPPSLDRATLEAVLSGIADDDLLTPVTTGALLEAASPTHPMEAGGPDAAGIVPMADRRAEVEQRLLAYESLVSPADGGFLRDLVAAAANRHLTDTDRAALLDAAEQQAAAGMRGIELADRGRVTITGQTGDLPLTLVNGQSLPVTVALELDSEEIDFPDGDRRLVSLEPGRNEVPVRIEARSEGDAAVGVAVTTPESGIVLDRGTARLRSVGRAGWGLTVLAAAGAGLAAWWARTARRSRRGRHRGAATVAGAGTGPGEGSTAASAPRRRVP